MGHHATRRCSYLLSFLLVFGPLIQVAHASRFEKYDIPLPRSAADLDLVEKTATTMRNDLQQNSSFHVLDSNRVNTILNYHLGSLKSEMTLPSTAERHLARAKQHWFNREYGDAEVSVNQAIAFLKLEKEKGDLLVDALLTKAVVFQETKRMTESKEVFNQVLKVDPSLTMEGLPLAGQTRQVFNQVRREVLERQSGGLEIRTDPPAVGVYLNGIRKGVTPLTLNHLPEGNYLLSLEANHYLSVHEPVYITASTTQIVNRKLRWQPQSEKAQFKMGAPRSTPEGLQEAVKTASQVGDALKVDKVVLVTTETKAGKTHVVVRTIDTGLQASHNPIDVPAENILKNEEVAVGKIVAQVKEQGRSNVLLDPQKYLEPDTGDIRVMRRVRPFSKSPVFYSLLGVLIGGAVGVTVGTLLNDGSGDGSSSSSDEGGVDIGF